MVGPDPHSRAVVSHHANLQHAQKDLELHSQHNQDEEEESLLCDAEKREEQGGFVLTDAINGSCGLL